MVYTSGDSVHIFTLDPSIGAYVLTQENVRMPEKGKTKSTYYPTFPEATQRYLEWVRSDEAGGYSLRYVESLVADFHRTLLCGGVFLYPRITHQDRGFAQ
jgi:fructose-1,6-bisphosphatase I